MKKLSIILLIQTVLAADINVNIIASNKDSDRKSSASGVQSNIISNTELETFQLYDGKLREAIQAYHGKKPDDVYVKSRTPWGDLYTTYGWRQIYRTITPVNTEIFFVQYTPIEIATVYFNNTDIKEVNKLSIKKDVENTVKSIWKQDGELANVKIHYDIKMLTQSGEKGLDYESEWNKAVSKSVNLTLGPENEVEVVLKPGQRAKAVLTGTRGVLKVRINYNVELSGGVAVNYGEPFKGHHFFYLDIERVLNAGGLNATVNFVEELTITYFSDYEIVITDIDTKERLEYS